MKILFAASECYPFIKTGGLGDVAWALPKALKKLGVDVRVILPKYSGIPEKYRYNMKHLTDFNINIAHRDQFCGIDMYELDGITFYFVDSMYFFDRNGLYGYMDDGERFSFFSCGVIEAMERIGFIPDIIHVNDWHTAVIPVLLKTKYSWINAYRDIKTILTIHNLKFQGIFPQDVLWNLLNLDSSFMTDNGFEFYGCANYMKAGMNYADFVTTVSPTYAREITYPFYGENLHGLISRIGYKVTGILNGIDTKINDPEKDPDIPYNYNKDNLENKAKDKAELQRELGLPVTNSPLVSIISRLTDQKGLDILSPAMEEILSKDIQMVVVGTGEAKYEDTFRYFAAKYPEKISSQIKFDAKLAQRVYAGSDMILVPSKFEPCGLTQMVGMRYGTVPIVRETGGLKDSVIPYNRFTGEGTGFTFSNYDTYDLIQGVNRALEAYKDKDQWKKIVRSAMEADFSWDRSALEYLDIYRKLT